MTDVPFFKTAMGRDFFDRNVPKLIKELERLNTNIEKLIKQKEAEKTDEHKNERPFGD